MGVQGAREAGEAGGALSPSAPRHSPNPMAGAGARHGGTTACQHRASNLGCTVRLFVTAPRPTAFRGTWCPCLARDRPLRGQEEKLGGGASPRSVQGQDRIPLGARGELPWAWLAGLPVYQSRWDRAAEPECDAGCPWAMAKMLGG